MPNAFGGFDITCYDFRMTSVAIANKSTILESLARGDLLQDVANSLSVTQAAISQQLSTDPEYIEARQIGIEARLERDYGDIRAADDALKVARGREAFRATSWLAERMFPAKYAAPASRTAVQVGNGDQTITIVHESR